MNTSTDEFFDARRSKYIKGFAITLMLFHHLFAFNDRIKNTYLNSIIIQISIITTCILLRGKYNIIDFIMVPLFIYASITCIEKLNLSNIFIYLGTHSTNMWLTHSFFCYYYFQNELFSFKYSLLIFILLIILSLISSYCINCILNYSYKFSPILKNKKLKVMH